MKKSNNIRGKYWYETEVWYCPVCLSEDKFRTRVYYKDRKKPKDYQWNWVEYYDYCDAL